MLVANDGRWIVMEWAWRKAYRSSEHVDSVVKEIRAARDAEDAQTLIDAAQTARLVRAKQENGFVKKLKAGFQRADT